MSNLSCYAAFATLLSFATCLGSASAEIIFAEDFDGGGVNSVFAFTNSGGAAPLIVDSGLLSNANVARITDLQASTNNAIAFDAFSLASVQARVTFEFRMSTDADNDIAGGCCMQAADGFGIGIFDTGAYGASGGINPAAGTADWEDPNTGAGFPGAVVISFDIFDGGDGLGDRVRVNGIGGPADPLGNFPAPFPLNDGRFHRAILNFQAAGEATLLSIDLIEDINDVPTRHQLASGLVLNGVDLAAIDARVIAGGRTGGAFVRTDLDNILIETFQGDDSDSDGMPDFWEEQNGLDKLDATDAGRDPDIDGLSNLEEFTLGSDPQDADSDDDSLSDLVETNTGIWADEFDRGTSPRSGDSDLDGLDDAVETNTGTFIDPFDTGTDPNIADSDGDQFGDGAEVEVGTDPTDGMSYPQEPIVLGTGTLALLGGDLTDPENDGAPDSNSGYNATFLSSEEPSFGAGEAAFNVFDNLVGATDNKWCCGDGANFPTSPIWVQATFEDAIVLTHFTLASGNDTPERDPRIWEIQGSDDGVNFETIHRHDDLTASVWGLARDQVVEWVAGIHYREPAPYTTIRFTCIATGLTTGARFQLNEIELFGTPGNLAPFAITSIALNAAGDVATIRWNSRADRIYALDSSADMADAGGPDAWDEVDDGIDSGGDTTSFAYPIPAGTRRLFFRIRDVSP